MIDSSDSFALEAFRDEVRVFLAEQLPTDLRRKVHEHKRLKKEDFLRWQSILRRRGWAAPNWPSEYGGTGWSLAQRLVFDDECAIAGAPETVPFGLRMVAPVLMKYGTQQQKDHYLPRILSGEDWWCQGYSEPGSGSDLASLRTCAELKDGEFIVHGQKTWTTYAQYADMMFCLVRTDPQAKAQSGISFLLIDMRSEGVTVRPIRTIDGDTEINEVFLDGVRVPESNLVGELNRGWTCAKYLLSHERFGAARVGRCKRELTFLKRLLEERIVDGVSLAQRADWVQNVARLDLELLALEASVQRLLRQTEGGTGNGAEASVLKLIGTTLAQAITERQLEAAGPLALEFSQQAFELVPSEPESSVSTLAGFYLNLRKISIYGGTDEVQRNIIAKMALGL
ncbi:putative acyl-CoA dehydrogenase FadE17 [Comamonas sp. PE63]|uniref:Acyl-CoA dehydrogenase FadE17 n=1 Tax=Comamonas brasiliensis TaxID=1812482 RepID=A0ABS5LP05_9BURK|nr:acyl-CoA dehydrogenase family protein [Comamonas sp. PE63]MBS3018056.1 putative acyl-CoA dehydrogenase FadE17 [Comamonas sp. PE63]